jgi:hypothetical protein
LHYQQVDPARHPQADDVARLDAGLDQARGGQAGLRVELAVGEPARAGDEGGLVGRALCARFQQVGQDFVAQQRGLVRSIQDIGVPREGSVIVHRRLDEGKQFVKQGGEAW